MTTEIKVIAFDVYGTILCTNDPDNVLPPRKGFFKLLEFVRMQFPFIKIVTVSDAHLDNLKIDLEDSGVKLALFDQFFKMEKGKAKDMADVARAMQILPSEMIVVGDNYEFDCLPAIECGAAALYVPEYECANDTFDIFEVMKPLITQ